MEGNKDLFHFHLSLCKFVKKVVSPVLFYWQWIHVIRHIWAKEENSMDISQVDREGRTWGGRACVTGSSPQASCSLFMPIVSLTWHVGITGNTVPRHRMMNTSVCCAACCRVPWSPRAAQESDFCARKRKKRLHTPKALLYTVFPHGEVTLSSLESTTLHCLSWSISRSRAS